MPISKPSNSQPNSAAASAIHLPPAPVCPPCGFRMSFSCRAAQAQLYLQVPRNSTMSKNSAGESVLAKFSGMLL